MSTEPLSTEHWVDTSHERPTRFYPADDIDTKFAALRAELAESIKRNGLLAGEYYTATLQVSQLATELGELQEVYTEIKACQREFHKRANRLEQALIAAKHALLYLSYEAREEIAYRLEAICSKTT